MNRNEVRICRLPLSVGRAELNGMFGANIEDLNEECLILPLGKGVFIFPTFASVVLWGVSRADEYALLQVLGDYSADGQVTSYIALVPFTEEEDDRRRLASAAYAIGASVCLGDVEDAVGELVQSVRNLPKELSKYGTIKSLSHREVNRKIGEVFVQRSLLHLVHRVAKTPDFLTELGDEAVYRKVRETECIESRSHVVTQRMKVLSNLLQTLEAEKVTSHGSLLVWIIILSIVLDVFVMTFQVILNLWLAEE